MTTKTKAAAAEPLAQRITISTRNPYTFLEEVGIAHSKGYRATPWGYLALNLQASTFMVEMEMIAEATA